MLSSSHTNYVRTESSRLYFHFLSHFLFPFILFYFLFQNLRLGKKKPLYLLSSPFPHTLGLGFSVILLSCCHISVIVTQSHITIEKYRRFWKNDII